MFVRGESVDFSIAFVTPLIGDVQKGDYVVFLWHGADSQEQGLKEGMQLVKRVGCMPKEKIVVSQYTAHCSNTELHAILQANSQGKAIYANIIDTYVPEHFFFAVGDSPMSYDSRYFGFVPMDSITHRVLFAF